MDAKYLAEIKARERAATPGPWEEKTNRHPQCNGEPWGWISGASGNITWSGYVGKTNADFIAHARADIPALLAEVERLTQARNYLQQLYDKLNERNENRSKQIASLKKALEFALDDLLDAATTPCSYCRNNPSNGGNCDMNNGHHEMFSCWIWQGVDPHQAQKQEAEK